MSNKCLSREKDASILSWPTAFTALERHGARELLAAIPNWASSGHLRPCSDADTHIKSLSSEKYPSILS
eukprot:scaffold898_cov160-Skeletonema_dohrnii-CCMP3373.AAC.2